MAQSKVVEGASSDKFVARHDTETEREERFTFYWKIHNFKDIYTAANKSSESKEIFRFPFTAGRNMGVPSNWEFHVKINNEGELAGELKFLESFHCGAGYILYLKNASGEYDYVIYDWDTTPYPKPTEDPEEQSEFLFETLEALQQRGFLSNDELQMKFKFKISNEETWMSATEIELKRDLSLDLKNMLESGVGADVTFIFLEEEGSQNIIAKKKAHTLILSQRSSVFATMFGSGMKEATDGQVRISDITPNAFGILLKFLYSGEVDEEWGSVAAELIYAADKYDLKALQKYLCENIASVLTARNVWKIRSLTSLYDLPGVLKSTMNFIKDNTEDVVRNVKEVVLKED